MTLSPFPDLTPPWLSSAVNVPHASPDASWRDVARQVASHLPETVPLARALPSAEVLRAHVNAGRELEVRNHHAPTRRQYPSG